MKSEDIIKYVKKYAEILKGEFNLTQKGVPRIIMTGKSMKISLVYAAQSKMWKAFYPYPAKNQERKYFSTSQELVRFLHDKGCR